MFDSTPEPKPTITEMMQSLSEDSAAVVLGLVLLLVSQERGRIEQAIAALEQIADGAE